MSAPLLKVDGIDLLTLDLHASLAGRLADAADADAADADADIDDPVESSGPLTLAIDLPAADGETTAVAVAMPAP